MSNKAIGTGLFHPVEHAIVAEYLGVAPLAPIDNTAEEDSEHISLDNDAYGEFGDNAFENAVARLVLGTVQSRLPQWAAVRDDGTVLLARHTYPNPTRKVSLAPQHLFTIN